MAVIMQAYDIPPEIQMGLAQGLYKVWGGVVRWAVGPNKGQIVKHLKPIDVNVAQAAKASPALGQKILNVVKNNKKAFAIGSVIVFTAASGAGAIYYLSHKKSKEELVFRYALNTYIDAVRTGNLDIEKIDNLVDSMETLKTRHDYNKIKLELSTQDLDILVNHIHDYTVKLASDNHIELSATESETQQVTEDNILCLQRYLNTQRRILKDAA